MTRLGVAALGLALAVSTAARGQMLGEVGAAMAAHNALAGTAAPNASAYLQQVREQLRNSGNPSGSTCPTRILADYGNRVATESAKQSAPKGAWVTAGQLGGKSATAKSWETKGTGTHAANNTAWAKNDKGAHAAAAPRR